MSLANCPDCGKLFNQMRERVCPACVVAEDELFTKVRDHMRDNDVHHVTQLSEETEVSRELILKWVDDGRLIMEVAASERPGCKRCGKPAAGGDLCSACRKEMAQEIAKGRQAAGHVDGHSARTSDDGNPRDGMHSRGS